jgi:hypothetical protein
MNKADEVASGVVIGCILGTLVMSCVIHMFLTTVFLEDKTIEKAFEDDDKYYIIKKVSKTEYHQWWVNGGE